ncbi:MAG: hypothetical protein AAF602_15760 [Myxococcota bacterium]
MASRREFTFGSMILALTGSRAAQAGIPELDGKLLPVREDPERAPRLDVDFTVSRSRDRLDVRMVVGNAHSEVIDVLAARGSLPAPYVEASIDIDGQRFELARIVERDRREVFTRAGPLPRYETVGPGASFVLGTYRFQWPDDVPDLPVRLHGTVEASSHHVVFDQTVHFGSASAKAS